MKKFLCILLVTVFCVTLCIGAFSVSVSATPLNGVDFTYITGMSSPVANMNAFQPLNGAFNGSSFLAFACTNDFTMFYVDSGSYTNFYVVTLVSDSFYNYNSYSQNQVDSTFNISNSMRSHTELSTTFYSNNGTGLPSSYFSGVSFAIPRYSDFTSGYSEAVSFLVNYVPPSPEPDPVPDSLNDGGTNLSVGSALSYSFVVPAGYMAVIEYQDELILDITQSFPSFSAILKLGNLWFWQQTSCYLESNSLPSIGSSYQYPSSSSLHPITFDKAEPFTDVTHQSKTGTKRYVLPHNTDYFYIVNPSASFYTDNGQYRPNYDMICHLNYCDSIRLYPITSSIADGQDVTYITVTVSGDPYWYTVSGLLRDPTESKNIASVEIPESVSDEDTVLNNLISNLTQFFSKGWSAARDLMDTLGDFPVFLSSLFNGFPSDLVAMITGLFGILCVIGVIKALV